MIEYHEVNGGYNMKKYIYDMLNKAVKNSDINMVKALYNGSPNNSRVKFEYARLLIKEGNITVAKNLLIELLDSKNKNYALLELGILSLMEKDSIQAKEYFNELLTSDNKRDICCALLELGRLESFYGNRDKAREYFYQIMAIKENEYYAMMELSRLEAEDGNIKEAKEILKQLIKQNENKASSYAKSLYGIILFNNHEYNELIKMINKEGKDITTIPVLIYLSIKHNIFLDVAYENLYYGYTVSQLLNYDEYISVEHIIDRHTKDFNHNIDIYKLFNDIKEELTLENKINKLNFNDIYSIYYPNIGNNGENNLRVITLPNTKNILTMYPIQGKYDMLIDEEEYKDIPKVKRKK